MTDAVADYGFCFTMNSPLGELEITLSGTALTGIRYLRKRPTRSQHAVGRAARRVESQLRRYFNNPHWRFDLETHFEGTDFQRRVWQLLTRIPCGKTLTYGEVAQRLKSGPRAVGNACRVNPIPIVIPCHRVIAANSVGGYCGNMRGKMLGAKHWLLQHEDFYS